MPVLRDLYSESKKNTSAYLPTYSLSIAAQPLNCRPCRNHLHTPTIRVTIQVIQDVFQYIRIPLLCIYEDDIALDYLKAIDDAVKDAGIVSHTATLRDYYNSINTFPYREQVQTVLILMPIEFCGKMISKQCLH